MGRSWGFLLGLFALTGMAKTFDDVEYSRPDGQSLRFDANIPDGPGPFAAVIVVHGGAWVTGDRRRSVEPLFEPLSKAGFAWFSIDYRLANVSSQDSLLSGIASATLVRPAIDDVRQAVAYVKSHAAEYRVDPRRIALLGESAGAQLASLAALKPNPGGEVQGVVALYGPSNLERMAQTARQIPDSVRQAIRGTPFEAMMMASLRELSPVNFVRKDAPPFFLIHGTADNAVPFAQSTELCDALKNAGASCDLLPVQGGGHGIRWWESNADMTSYKLHLVGWLRAKLGAQPPATKLQN